MEKTYIISPLHANVALAVEVIWFWDFFIKLAYSTVFSQNVSLSSIAE